MVIAGARTSMFSPLVLNRQRRVRLDLPRLRAQAALALPLCLAAPGPEAPVLPALVEIGPVEITLVSDAVIARLHADYCGVPGATDVITFQHGELVVSAETAARQSAAAGEPLDRELARYVVHGLLHLMGHRDEVPTHRRQMWAAQERIVRAVCKEPKG